MNYQLIDKSHAKEIGKLAVLLTNEIIERTGSNCFDVDEELAVDLCTNYLSSGLYSVIAAFDNLDIIGFCALCESQSLYAKGSFGIIQEFYILPIYRSQGVGKHLISSAIQFSKTKKWKRLELCTPSIPEFNRTYDFYKKNGFEITGGYKMKYET